MTPGFWKGRRVFITGHTGFKGSWLSLWLQQLGAEVTGYALPAPTTPSLFALGQIDHGIRSVIGDVLDLSLLTQTLQKAKPEVVMHLAAQPLVRDSYQFPVETFTTNIIGTANLLEAVRRTNGVKAVVVVTSDKCYENREWPWGYREEEPMGGHDPYSASKGCAELITASYRRSFFPPDRIQDHGVALATARAGNVIGGGDWAKDRLVPDILKAMEADREVIIRSPGALRPWQHVLEPLGGYMRLAEALHQEGSRFAQAWNFGPWDSDTRPVQWIVERLTSSWGQGAGYRIETSQTQVHEANYLKLDISKARQELGWQPRWSLDRCMEAIVQWHQAYLSGADMRAFTLGQIQDFEHSTL